MSKTVIQAGNIGKKYFIHHKTGVRYKALRDVLVKKSISLGRQIFNASNKQQLTSTREEFWALKNVTFDVKQGEVIGVIGRNGTGKSTLLKVLSRITEPTTGRINIKGRVASLLEVGTGFHPELTGRENIFLNGAILGMTKAEIKSSFDEIVFFSGVEKFLDTPVKRYSSGMYVRLAFAVAAHLNSEILLIDEVLAVGDASFQKKCLGKMEKVSQEGRTVLFVSHNMGAISSLCQKVILLEGGKVAFCGRTSETIDAYNRHLQGGLQSKEAELRFDRDPNKQAQILRICMLDQSGQPSLRHEILNPIHIEIDYILHHPFTNLIAACTIRTVMGPVVFTTNDMDWTNYSNNESFSNHSKESGRYRASVILPAPLLHVGNYELICSLAIPNAGIFDRHDGILFEIIDSSGSFATIPFKRNGYFAVPLQWQSNQLSKPSLLQDN
jgi:lipopolysaccharide transport system ATP-binding protein